MNPSSPDPSQAPLFYCANHPQIETSLRCNRCEKPICTKCAVLTPTGYRCKECVRGQQKVFETAEARDYLLAIPLAGILGFLGGLIVPNLSFFVFFISPAAGAIFAEIIRRVLQKRRSKRLFQLIAVAVFLGGMLPSLSTLLFPLWAILMGEQVASFLAGVGFSLLWQGIYAFMVSSTVYYRLAGIQI
ncbi:MAG: hypothetical protein HUU38_02990 [Anaerolineales bacterium]|jgi:hypothetical protein|nr:hypothetical protein [Anaerolineales bacterium]